MGVAVVGVAGGVARVTYLGFLDIHKAHGPF